jgi:predicted ferric reductase
MINDREERALRTRRLLSASFWIFIYLLLTLAPLLVLIGTPTPAGRYFLREVSVALGFAGLGVMALQFALTARIGKVNRPFGSDVVYHFHRQISIVAFVLILAHPIILFVTDPETIALLNIFTAPWRARFATVGLVALIAIIVTSVWRKQLKIDYYAWKIAHGLLAIGAVAFALTHAIMVGYYINTPWKQALWVAYGVFWIGLLIYVRLVRPIWLMRRPWRVEEIREERGNAYTMVLRPDGHTGQRFQPGQFAWISVWHTPFAETEHPFSYSSSAEVHDRIEFTIKELGDFTSTIKTVPVGQKVYVDGPYGAFVPDDHPAYLGYIFIAGGVGITPVVGILRTLADRGEKKPLLLFYGNKDWEGTTFREELAELQKRLDLEVVYIIEKPEEDWKGESGFITADLLRKYMPKDLKRNNYEIFLCGPEPMLNAVEPLLEDDLDVSWDDIHLERFNLV